MLFLLGVLDQTRNVVRLVHIDEAEFLEVDVLGVVVVYEVVHLSVVLQRHRDAAELKALYEFFKLDVSVEIDVEVSERSSVVLEFLFEAEVNLSEEALHVILPHERFVFMGSDFGYFEVCLLFVATAGESFFIDGLVVLEALNVVGVVVILQIIGVAFVGLLLLSGAFLEACHCF